jgi:hypothetical protein
VSGLGTGVAAALATNTGTAGAVVLFDGSLGTPASGTVTNLTGTASININGTVGATTASTGAFTTLSATGVTTVQAGTAALPAITTTGDTNTGIFFPAADTIAFSEGGTEAMRIDSSGNLGIGYTTINTTIAVNGNALFGTGAWPTSDFGRSGSRFVNASSTEDGYLAVLNMQSGVGASRGGYIYMGARATTGVDGSAFATIGGIRENATSGNYATALVFSTASGGSPAEKMRLDSSGRLGLGTTTPDSIFGIGNTQTGTRFFYLRDTYADIFGGFNHLGDSGGFELYSISNGTDRSIRFSQGASYAGRTERARIDSSGNLLVGKTSDTFSAAGARISSGGVMTLTADSNELANFNRLTNDGVLLYFSQASTIEGSISVSGTTVTYGGGHLARFGQLPDGSEDPTLLKGTVLTNLDEMCVWINKETGIPADNEQCNKVKISDVDGDANVAGVFVSWSYDEQHDTNDLFVAMTGDMIIRIAQGVTVQRGDLLMSAGDGTAKPQGDDIVRSKTVAKVTSTHVTCTYADGSYCVPCVLMAC